MNKFLSWIKSNDKKQRGVAEKLHISLATLHAILREGQMPSLKLAYKIEEYTRGDVTVYDWLDEILEENGHEDQDQKAKSKITIEKKIKNIMT